MAYPVFGGFRTGTTVLAVLIPILASSGCSSTKYAGMGPLTLGPQMTQKYQDYKDSLRSADFMVTLDGKCGGYTECPDWADACHHRATGESVLNSCLWRCGRPCYVLAIQGRVVWQGPVTDANGKLLNP